IVSHGATSEEAQEHARLTNYPVKQQGNLLMFSNQLQLPKKKPFYGQHAKATLYIPYGQPFSMEYNMRNILYNTLTPWGYGTKDLSNNTFSFNQQGELECLTCPTERLHEVANGQQQSISADGRILNFKDFDKIKVGSNYQLTVVQGQEFKVEVSGDEDELDNMEVKQQGSILSFFTEDWVSGSWLKSRKNKKPAHIFVSVPSLAGLYLSGASRAQVEMEQDKPLAVDMSGASEMQGKLKVKDLEIDMSGSSEVSLEGSCTTLKADLSGASELQAPELKTAKAIIDLSGASEANIWVTERLNADITGGSDLTYRGNPAQANIDKSSGASAHRRDD
ncbi:MAG: DUF2807 domain-containing protein, partial [Bacteroidetes bacterium]|nr:DUF2807 domain-containing protein [Bacteroidota bacterium]